MFGRKEVGRLTSGFTFGLPDDSSLYELRDDQRRPEHQTLEEVVDAARHRMRSTVPEVLSITTNPGTRSAVVRVQHENGVEGDMEVR